MQNIDSTQFVHEMPDPGDMWLLPQEPDILCNAVSNLLYKVAKECKVRRTSPSHETFADAANRWKRIVDSRDSKELWQSVNWKGEFATPTDKSSQPGNDVFCQFYKDLLSSPEDVTPEYVPETQKFVPVLDNPIAPYEVDSCIKKLKANKAAGIDGVPLVC